MCFKRLDFDLTDKNDSMSTTFQDRFSQKAESEKLAPLEFPDDLDDNTQMLIEEEEGVEDLLNPFSFGRKNQRRWTFQEEDKNYEEPSLSLLVNKRHDSYQGLPTNFGGCINLVRTVTAPAAQETSQFAHIPHRQEPVLPLSTNLRDPDLWTISPQTLVNLMNNPNGKRYLVIDCRYDYEYKGGHINDAINIDAPETLERVFLSNPQLLLDDNNLELIKNDLEGFLASSNFLQQSENNSNSSEPPILIFHCEFSQKRGPRAMRALRNLDRQLNSHRWPSLSYPQVYLLSEGYQNFHKQFPEYCCPQNSYVRMLDQVHKTDYAEARERERNVWKKSTQIKPTLNLSNPFIQRSRTFTTF